MAVRPITLSEIYQIARAKSYYVPAEKASQEEITHVKSVLTQMETR